MTKALQRLIDEDNEQKRMVEIAKIYYPYLVRKIRKDVH